MRNLTRRIPPSQQAESRSRTMDREPELQEHGSLVGATARMAAAAEKLLQIQLRGPRFLSDLTNIIEEGIKIYDKFQRWSEGVSEKYQYKEIMPPVSRNGTSAKAQTLTQP